MFFICGGENANMNPVHILAKPEDLAQKALIAGDPGRVKKISEFLDKPKLVNDNRGFLVYTGNYKGSKVTIATHGIGGPSTAIVVEELHMLGVKTFIRLGTAGSLVPTLKIGDVLVATGASHLPGGTIGQYVGQGVTISPAPDIALTMALTQKLRERGINFREGMLFSSDAFYAEDSSFVQKWSSLGNLAVEMECATLFSLGRLRGLRTAASVIISDELAGETKWIDRSTLESKVEQVSKAVLEVLAEAG
jgi:5'-methylthioadenosine phosphorylase